ncbi:TetR/AcrR family transcriptional regulator [Shewanella sp. Isolate11]|uniref:TetR/AcrR family transcriptional regulator n=1 Tax=Shewanella sp. Isolate11 TaxID=2908530 RepID=UPI001EFCEF5B|nr:TetR/AcrR family transcriptional regulator [Shewanella sp. Isolate11]MCG9695747.1 TetR/AcrR family transcriptional regulator [Shewanella sp. Isolate11]
MKITDKKKAILDTALTLFVEQGFHATSTAAIARGAGVATGTLFHHFPSKEALMEYLFLNIKQEFADAIKSSMNPDDGLKANARNLWFSALEWAANNPVKQHFFQLYSLSPTIATELREQAMNSILGFITDLIKQGQAKAMIADYPIKLMQDNCHGQFLAATRYFSDNPDYWHIDSHKQASFKLFWHAIAS